MSDYKKISKEKIFSSLHQTSNEIANAFDKVYDEDFEKISEELAYSYDNIFQIINRDDQTSVSNADFQSALLFWTALNTILSAIELFRRGYSKEPQMLVRNAVEIFSSAYDIHIHPEKYNTLQTNQNNFNSTDSISIAKKIHPFIGQMYGVLSDYFSHVSILHSLPHKSDTPICIGGIYDPKEQKYSIFSLSILITVIDIIGSIIEFTFFEKIKIHRRWSKIDEKNLHFTPDPSGHGIEVADRLKNAIDLMKKTTTSCER